MLIRPGRREFLKQLAASISMLTLPGMAFGQNPTMNRKVIPSSGQSIPVIGMGTWITFNVGNDRQARLQRTEVLRTFFERGGEVVDSSPMYGSAEAVLGFCLEQLGDESLPLFSATKVWTSDTDDGKQQIRDSHRLWGIPRFNLFQIHNLVNWQAHLDTLLQMKADDKLQYVGITTSHGRRHQDLERIILDQPIDFVQLTYHINNRAVEQRLLPAAMEKGVAVLANRPFSGGSLFNHYQGKPLPNFARDIGCEYWAQYFLKYVVSHPAISCAIPATSKVNHMHQNMSAGYGVLPDAELRQRMFEYAESI